jgi:hypothetical protein
LKPLKTNLDIYGITKSTYWDIVQGDVNAYPCEFTILAHGKPYDMSEGTWTATITWVRANKTTVLTGADKITIEGNVLKYTLESNVYAVPGALVASVELYKDGSRLTTCQFTAKVREQLSDGAEIPSQDEYNVLIDLLAQVTASANQTAQAKADAESAVGELNTMKGTLQGWLDDPEQFRGPQGIQGETGPQGEPGQKGDPGLDGEKGDTGLSAYEVWLAQGNAGTEADYLASLKGDKGDPGEVTQAEFDAHLNDYATLEQDYAQHKLDYVQQTTDIKSRFQLAHFDHVKQEYVNLDQFWNSLRNGKIYTVEFNQFDVSPSPLGIKKHDNEGLVCEPSTNTIRGRNDYENIGLFMSIDVNAYVDENDDYHVIAIKGDGRFKNDGTMGDVYVMAMPGYQKRYADENVWGISYSDAMHPGFEILDEAVKPDGTIRPYLLHAKYVAGRNPHEDNNLSSISGVYPEYVGMSHNGQITEFKKKGVQYSGKTSHDDYYVQLMMWLKYATTHSQSIMAGASSYYLQYTNLVPEAGVKRVIITNAQANNLLVGSTVSIGDYGDGTINADRNVAQNYNIANRVNIIDIVDLGDGNSAVYVDSPNAFNTTLTTTITTYPWTSGACDNVLGQDGSPTSSTSGKEPFIINGIEMMVGGYEVLQNLIIYNNNTDSNNYKIQVYACYDCRKYATSPTADYDLVGHELVQTDQAWKYISKIGIDPVHPTVMVPVETEASSTTGFADGVYTSTPVTGYREWLSLGLPYNGANAGLRYLTAFFALSNAYWNILGRLSATGRSRRRAGVN